MRRYTFIMPLHQPIVDVLKYFSQELHDISTMAVDHFKDKIVPTLKRSSLSSGSRTPSKSLSDELLAISKKVSSLERQTQKQMAMYKQALEDQNKKITDQNKKITQLEKCLGEQDVVSKDQESKIAELTRKLAECDHKQNDYLPTSKEQ